jgi:RNA polymerase sigma-70 factor (ECF subfamily)
MAMTVQRSPAAPACSVIAAMYETHRHGVLRYLCKRCGDRGVAEELAAETFACAFASLLRHPAPAAPLPWLLGIATHKLIDHWRRDERDGRTVLAAIDQWHESCRPRSSHTEADDLRRVLEKLEPHHREALVLRYCDELSVTEMAQQLHRSVHSTESLLARARCAFRKNYLNFFESATEEAARQRLQD